MTNIKQIVFRFLSTQKYIISQLNNLYLQKNFIPMEKYFNYLLAISLTLVLVSCGGNENDDDHIYSNQMSLISLIPDRYNVPLNDNVEEQEFFTFKVTNNAGDDITNQSIIYVNDIQLEGNIFTPSELGTFDVYAKYIVDNREFLSQPKTVNVVVNVEDLYFKHKVLVEDFTGTWCGWCTRIIYALELIEAQTHNVIPVAIHNNDEFDFAGRVPLEDHLGIGGAYPFAAINRTTIWSNPQHHNVSQPIDKIQPQSPIGIKINSNLGANSGTIDVNFKFKEAISGELKYAVYVVENGLIANQKNYNTDLYDGLEILSNFTHNHTLRGVYGNIIGNDLGQAATEGLEVTLSNLAVNYTVVDVTKLQVVVFLMAADGTVLNVQIADRNTEVDYEYAF
jgi:hypothetical protein